MQFQFFLATGFGFVLLSSSVALILLLNNEGDNSVSRNTYFTQAEDAITFEEFINREFSSKTFNGSWWSDTELQWKDTVNLALSSKGVMNGPILYFCKFSREDYM